RPCQVEVMVVRRGREPEDQRVVVRPSEPGFDLRVIRIQAVRVEQVDRVPGFPDHRRELEQAVRLEHGVPLRHLAPFLPHNGDAVESGRVHEGDLHDAAPPHASSNSLRVRSAIRSTVAFSSTHPRARAATSRARPASERTVSTRSTSPSTSPGGNSHPDSPSVTISRTPPAAAAIRGVPLAIASSATMGQLSEKLGRTTASARWYSAGIAPYGTEP